MSSNREARWTVHYTTDARGVSISRDWTADDSAYTVTRNSSTGIYGRNTFEVWPAVGGPAISAHGMVSDAIDAIEALEAADQAAADAAAEVKQPGCLCINPAKPSPLCPVCDAVTAANTGRDEMRRATTGDDVLTALYSMRAASVDARKEALAGVPVRLLRAAADLCGVDSESMTKHAAIKAITENF